MITHFFGEFSLAEFLEARQTVATAPLISPDYSHIIDFSAVSRFTLTAEEVQQLARQPSVLPPETLQVIVAPDPAAFQLARMFQTYTEPLRPHIHVVKTLADALNRIKALKGKAS